MDERHREVLTTNWSYLVENISNIQATVDGLFNEKVLLREMKQQIEAENTEFNKIRKLLDILMRRGPLAFEKFLQVLVDNGNDFIVKHLETKLPQTQEDQELPCDWPTTEHCLTSGFLVIKSEGPELERLWNGSDVYEMKHVPRGRAVIINNEIFKRKKTKDGKVLTPQRKGSEKDEEGLNSLFKQLDFEVEVYKDQTANKILRILDEEKERHIYKHSDVDCFVLVILTYGCREGLYGYDLKTVSLETIESLLDGQSWPQMKDKPKLLFIQACRGKNKDVGAGDDAIPPDADGLQEKMASMSVTETAASSSTTTDGPRTPTAANILIAQSTTFDMVSYRDTTLGSWFIQAVVFIFRKYAHSLDLNGMLTKVNELVSKGQADGGRHVTVSEVTTTLTKRFYFFPGLKKQ